jgi:membrane-bound serine protease (ClpP class)
VIIPLKGDIEPSKTVFLRRSIDSALSQGAEVLIFEINTFGGRVDSALEMATLIGAVEAAKTVAYISADSESLGVSWSAGALISLACDEIYMESGTSLGAAAPVYLNQGESVAASEKEVSAVRTQLAALAEKNGYPRGVALAMVDKDEELLEVYLGEELRLTVRRDLPDLEREAREKGVDLEEGKVISPEGKLLTLTAGEMARYGVSSGTVEGREDLLLRLGLEAGSVQNLQVSQADSLVALITSSAVVSLLLTLGFVAVYIEISSPGFGIPGVTAILAFSIIFIGNGMLGTVSSVELLLFLAGLILLVVEIFLIPGFGVAGTGGIILMVGSLILSRQDFVVPQFDWEWTILRGNILSTMGSFLAALGIVVLLIIFFPRIRPFRKLMLETTLGDGSFRPSNSATDFSTNPPAGEGSAATNPGQGDSGETVTPLRPVGKVRIGGAVHIAQTRGEFVEASRPVRVVEVQGNRITVREV